MIIKKMNYWNGEAFVVFEEDPSKTLCVDLSNKESKKDVIDELLLRFSEPDDLNKKKYQDWNLKGLEGSDIAPE